MRPRIRLVCALALAIAVAGATSACGSLLSASPTPVAIAVTGAAPAVGGTSQLRTVALMSDGTSQDITSSTTYSSSDTTIATVSPAGVVTGIGSGTATITGTYQSLTGTLGLIVP